MKKATLIYPHQLFENTKHISQESCIFLIEEPLLFTQYSFHKQKLMFHRASMQAYKGMLMANGYEVVYIESKDIQETGDIANILMHHGVQDVSFYDPVDDWLFSRLTASLKLHSITHTKMDTPMFLTTSADLDSFFLPLVQKKKKFLMKTFYEWQRKRLGVLIDEAGAPVGGQWSFDEDNRKKLPKGIELPPHAPANTNAHVAEAREYCEKYFKNNYGETELFFYPVTHEEAKLWLEHFLVHKLSNFGPYEDAVTTESNVVFHSVLSPLLNAGLLTPSYVLKKTLAHSQAHTVPLPSLEGFIRQLIGWREYVRAVYVYLGRKERTSNYFQANRSIPKSFWNGTTGIVPIDDTVRGALQYAYSHHIPRLMIMGNFMNLCGFKPDDVYRWFMEMYIDAYDWVMVPNVYSMALYADGGLITTKPYISSSKYILSMSNYKTGPWSTVWDALFWNFVGIHYEKLTKEGRLGFIGVTYQKMSIEKKLGHKQIAEKFLYEIEE